MTYIMFSRWFGVVSILLSLGILFNLEDARVMAKHMVAGESGYIMGGVLPIIFGTMSLMFSDSFDMNWQGLITVVGAGMLFIGIYRVIFVNQWRKTMTKHLDQIPFLFSLFGLMFGVILLYVGFVSPFFDVPL